jgi:HAD superfamily hydrolase (TIGR01549 family)
MSNEKIITYAIIIYMIKAIISDLSRVILFSKDKNYTGSLNSFHSEKLKDGDYNFWEYFELNGQLVKQYQELSKKCNLYIFTTQYIQEYPPIKTKLEKFIKKVFIANDIGFKKDQPEAFQYILDELQLQPEEIIYIDDLERNIIAAKSLSIKTIHYKDVQATIEAIAQYNI